MGVPAESGAGLSPIIDIARPFAENFERVAGTFAGRRALKTRRFDWTYGQLNRAANAVASIVLERTRNRSQNVAFLLDNDAPAVATIFGILKSGMTYVPVDPGYPRARVEHILQDSQAEIVLTDAAHLDLARRLVPDRPLVVVDDAIDRGEAANPKAAVSENAPAVIFYTSGSTGKPKGVVDVRRNMLYEIALRVGTLGMREDDRMVSFSSFSFSVSLRQLFPPLFCGASVFILDVNETGIPMLPAWLRENAITVLSGRAIIRQMVANLPSDERFESVRLMTFGGDTIYKADIEVCRKHFDPDIMMVNLASTEAGSMSRFIIDRETVLEDTVVPVGYTVPYKEILLLDESGEPVAPGAPGEIAVKSRFLSAGYWNRPELTREKFLDAPDGERIFLTGDLGRIDDRGRLFHLGRKDFQVKVRGYRVETAEVEQALLDTGEVEETIVLGRDQAAEDGKLLVAYVVPSSGSAPTVSRLRAALAKRIAAYMVPTRFVFLESMPRTATGKVDRRALPEPAPERPALDVEFVAARTPVEEQLASIWSDVLTVSPVGVLDNFFDLGGHSLRAAQLLSRVKSALGVDVSVQSFFESPTVAEQAAMIAGALLEGAGQDDLQGLLDAFEAGPSFDDTQAGKQSQ